MFSTVPVILLASQVIGNLYCSSSECKSCTKGYNFKSKSCLDICPSGYFINSMNCSASASQELFSIDFLSYKLFDSSTIGPFAHPEKFSFNNETKVTPFVTIDRGFYFFSSSLLVSNTSWILAPEFCMQIFLKVFEAGTIFKVVDGSTVYFSLNYNKTLQFELFYSMGSKNFSEKIDYDMIQGSWRRIIINIYQYPTYLYRNYHGLETRLENWEFRMSSDKAKFMIGGTENSSFEGFIARFQMINSLLCSGYALILNSCLFNEYLSYRTCVKCSDTCGFSCRRASCSLCYSNLCSSCNGYLYEHCDEESKEILLSSILVKNCAVGSGFTCFECLSGFVLIANLCIKQPSYFTTITLRFDYFVQYQGGLFQSGLNASTFSPFNNPEPDDPVAMSLRGYMFGGNQFMFADNFSLNHSFTITIWANTGSFTIFYSEKLKLFYDSTVQIILEKIDDSLDVTTTAKCYLNGWKFFGIIVEYFDNSTHLTTICGSSLSSVYSVYGYAFYDSPGRITLTSSSNIYYFAYRMTFSQFALYDISIDSLICSSAGSSSCLGVYNHSVFNSSFQERVVACHSSCKTGCLTWGTCNKCAKVLCQTCENYNITCVEDLSWNPCLEGFHLSYDMKRCCSERCTDCYGPQSYNCLNCAVGYVLVGSFCSFNCPTNFKLVGNKCEFLTQALLSIVFDKIANNFTDNYNNQFSLGSYDILNNLLDQNDPIPAHSRGFYFTGSSFIKISNFSLPINNSISFFIRQKSPGILLIKESLKIDSSIEITYKNFSLKSKSIANSTWMFLSFRFNVYFELYSLNFVFSNEVSRIYHRDFVFDDPFTPMFIGSALNGFVGFIWKMMIFRVNIATAIPLVCNETVLSDCLWNCSLSSFYSNNTCTPCLNNCTQGCVRSTDCNICSSLFCSQCEYFNESCKTCIENASKNVSTLACQCNSGFYWNMSYSKCLPCIKNCEKCTFEGSCIQCRIDLSYNGNECACKDGYYLFNDSCSLCNNKCLTCKGPEETNCTTCKDGQNLVNDSCVCPVKFFLNGENCLPCPSDCLNCINSTFCLKCDETFMLIDGLCECKPGFYHSLNVCNKCHNLCLNCSGPSASDCLSCRQNFSLTLENSCICEDFYYLQDSECLYCDPIKNLEIIKNSCSCPHSSFWDNFQCIKCHNSCKSCLGPTAQDCLECQNNSLKNIENLCICEKSFYWNGNSCILCDINLNLEPDSNKCKCLEGFFLINDICEPCSPKCRTCFGYSENECLSCEETKSISNTSHCECKKGYFAKNDSLQCLSCLDECQSCEDFETCIDCKDLNSELNNDRRCACKKGFYSIKNQCKTCPENCSVCALKSNQVDCTECNFGFNLFQASCQPTCGSNESFTGESCECLRGYVKVNESCIIQYFYLNISVTADNKLKLTFNKPLQGVFSTSNISIKTPPSISSFNLLKITAYKFLIYFRIIESISNGTKIKLSLHPVILSEDNFTLSNHEFSLMLFEYQEISLTFKKLTKNVKAAGQSSTLITYALSMFTNPSAGWVLQNNIQMIAFLPLSRNDLTPAANKFCRAVGKFNSPVNVPERFLNKNASTPPFIQARKIGIETTEVLINIGSNLTIFTGVLLLFPVVFIFSRLNLGKISEKFRNLKMKYKYSLFIRFWLQTHLACGIFGFMSFDSGIENFGFQSIFSKVLSMILITIFLASPIIILLKLWIDSEKILLQDEIYLREYGSFFQEFHCDRKFSNILYYVVLGFRSVIFAINQLYLSYNETAQRLINVVISFILLSYLVYFRPFKDKLILITNIVIEFLMILVFIIIFARRYSKFLENDNVFDICFISVLMFGLAFQYLIVLLIFASNVKSLIAKLRREKSKVSSNHQNIDLNNSLTK